MDIDGVKVDVLDEPTARVMRHDSVPPPSRDQETNLARLIEKEAEDRLPFEDDEED